MNADRGPLLGWDEARAAVARVRQARTAAGLTQRALAARLGVGPGWLSLRESGATRLSAAEEARIAAAIRDGAA